MNGYEVCRLLRADPDFKNVILIAQTGWAQQKDRSQAKEVGFDHHLVKPVDYEKLFQLIESHAFT